MLVLTGVAPTIGDARDRLRAKLESGEGLQTFTRMVEAHGGNPAVCENLALLPKAACMVEVPARCRGFVSAVSAEAIGRVVLLLGGGRHRTTDHIDPAVGVDRLVKIGEHVATGEVLMRIHARDGKSAGEVLKLAQDAVTVGPDIPVSPPLIYETRREVGRS